MSNKDLGTVPSIADDEPYLIFDDDCPWWMGLMLARVTVTRDQWRARMRLYIVLTAISLVLSALLFGIAGLILMLVFTVVGVVFSYYGYKIGREKAIEYRENRPAQELKRS